MSDFVKPVAGMRSRGLNVTLHGRSAYRRTGSTFLGVGTAF